MTLGSAPKNQILTWQAYRCAICNKPIGIAGEPPARSQLVFSHQELEIESGEIRQILRPINARARRATAYFDHDHRTGRVRGAVCPSCNMKLAGLDDPIWLGRATEYLANPPAHHFDLDVTSARAKIRLKAIAQPDYLLKLSKRNRKRVRQEAKLNVKVPKS